jgi:hypothetical protein
VRSRPSLRQQKVMVEHVRCAVLVRGHQVMG